MSAENCPFQLERAARSDEERRKDKFVSFEAPIDPDDPDGLKSSVEIRKLDSTEAEDVLTFFQNFDENVEQLDINEGLPRFRFLSRLLGSDARETWNSIAENYEQQDQATFDAIREEFLLTHMTRDIAEDTKDWIQSLKKPQGMTVQTFLKEIRRFNHLIDIMPLPQDGDDVEPIPRLTEAELTSVLRHAVPKSWSHSQTRANLRGLTTVQQAQYFESLRNIEEPSISSSTPSQGKRSQSRGQKQQQAQQTLSTDTTPQDKNTCPIHLVVHPNGEECSIIRRERLLYQEKLQQREQQQQSSTSTPSHGYNLRSRGTPRAQQPSSVNAIDDHTTNDNESISYESINEVYDIQE